MSIVQDMKKWVRGNPRLHGTAKLARDLPRFISSGGASDLDRMLDISRVYAKTMLKPPRLHNICDVVEWINEQGIPGDIAECGTWSGGALALFAIRDMKHPGSRRRYIGFDSFEGYPVPTEEDDILFRTFSENSAKTGRKTEKQLQKTGVCVGDSVETVNAFFRGLGIPEDRFRLYAGWFQDTIPEAVKDMGQLAALRVNGDYYDSVTVCLTNLFDHVSPGGYVIVDTYGIFPGCKRAVDEFRAARGVETPITFIDTVGIWFRKPSVGSSVPGSAEQEGADAH